MHRSRLIQSPPRAPKTWVAATWPTSTWPTSSAAGAAARKDQLMADVEQGHQAGGERERERHVAAGVLDLVDHVGRGVPARVGVHHEEQRDRELFRENGRPGRPRWARRRSPGRGRTARPRRPRRPGSAAILKAVEKFCTRLPRRRSRRCRRATSHHQQAGGERAARRWAPPGAGSRRRPSRPGRSAGRSPSRRRSSRRGSRRPDGRCGRGS